MGDAKVAVAFKPGYESGRKVVQFNVETDDQERPVRTLILEARLVSAFEVAPLDGSTRALPLGEAGRQEFRLTARRKGKEGRDLPGKVSTSPPLGAEFRGEPVTETNAQNLVEATRRLVVNIPHGKRPGSMNGEIIFTWADGQTETRPISWEVLPRLRVSPSGLVFHKSPEPIQQKIFIRSDQRPFRLEGVSSPFLSRPVDLPRGAAARHELALLLDVSRAPAGQAVEIEIKTDHPDQPSVSLSVLILPESEEDGS